MPPAEWSRDERRGGDRSTSAPSAAAERSRRRRARVSPRPRSADEGRAARLPRLVPRRDGGLLLREALDANPCLVRGGGAPARHAAARAVPAELQLGRGETIADTARTLSAYAAAIVVRAFRQGDVDEMARHASVPVVNALTDEHHPCQALADLLTLRERFGDPRRAAARVRRRRRRQRRPLARRGAALTGIELVVCGPEERRPNEEIVERALATRAVRWSYTSDLEAGVVGADAVYTDVWVSMGDEAETERRHALPRPYR